MEEYFQLLREFRFAPYDNLDSAIQLMKNRSLFDKKICFNNRGFWKARSWDEVVRETIPLYKFWLTYYSMKGELSDNVSLCRNDAYANDEFKVCFTPSYNNVKIVYGRHIYSSYYNLLGEHYMKFQHLTDEQWLRYNFDYQMESVLGQLNGWGNYLRKWEKVIRGKEYVFGLL